MKEKFEQIVKEYGLRPRESVHLTPSAQVPTYLGTKVGGTPFLLKESSLPQVGGEYLKLAVQVNFEDLPKLEPYPEDGILQFWIGDRNRSEYEYYKVLYYSKDQLSQGLAEEEARELYLNPDETTGLYPMYGSFSLEAGPAKEEYMTNYVFDILDEEYLDDEEVFSYFHSIHKGTKIGGYPFTYRCHECETTCPDPDQYKPLVLQIDSMEHGDASIIWEDLGLGHITVSWDELRGLDFENAYFYWDSPDFGFDF